MNDMVELVEVNDPPEIPAVDGLYRAAQRIIESLGSDVSHSEWFVASFRDRVRYCEPLGWLTYDGRRWKPNAGLEVQGLAKLAARKMHALAAGLGGKDREALIKHALALEGNAKLKAMVELARDAVAVSPDDLDPDPWLLNVENATVDLRTGTVRPQVSQDLITKLAPVRYDPDAECPTWDAFVGAVLPDPATREFVRRFAGYSLTGSTREQLMTFLVGAGANGKTTLINALIDTLGPDYGIRSARDLVMLAGESAHPTGTADLYGKRLVVVSETDKGARLNEGFVKDLTGSDTIRARRMHKDFFEFRPTHKFAVASNHAPRWDGDDHGIDRRVRIVPFPVTFWNPDAGESGPAELRQDKGLADKLAAGRSGVLNWMIRGCLDWQRDGMPASAAMNTAKADVRHAASGVKRFMVRRTVRADGATIPAKVLYDAYASFAGEERITPVSSTAFGKDVAALGYDKGRTAAGNVYRNLRLAEKGEWDVEL